MPVRCRVVRAHDAQVRVEEEMEQRLRVDSNRRCRSLPSQQFLLAVVGRCLFQVEKHSLDRSAGAGRFGETRKRAGRVE